MTWKDKVFVGYYKYLKLHLCPNSFSHALFQCRVPLYIQDFSNYCTLSLSSGSKNDYVTNGIMTGVSLGFTVKKCQLAKLIKFWLHPYCTLSVISLICTCTGDQDVNLLHNHVNLDNSKTIHTKTKM